MSNVNFEHFKKKVELDYNNLNYKIEQLRLAMEQQHLENIRSDELLLATVKKLETRQMMYY